MLEFIVPFTDKAAAEKFDRCHGTNGELVRCKDCKNYNTNGCSAGFGWCEDSVVNTGVSDDFYCANGDRRDDDATD